MNAARVLPARCAVVAFQPAALSRSLHVLSRTVADRRNRKPFRVCADAATSNPLETVINGITVLLKNSPLNAGKKALAIAQAGDYDVQGTKAKLDQLIAENPVMVFSWLSCPFCKRAKALLDDLGVKYKVLELDQMGKEGSALRAELAKLTDRTSMPNIFIAGKGVGGCNDGPGVVTLQKNGELLPLLKAAGAL